MCAAVTLPPSDWVCSRVTVTFLTFPGFTESLVAEFSELQLMLSYIFRNVPKPGLLEKPGEFKGEVTVATLICCYCTAINNRVTLLYALLSSGL